MTDSLSNLPPMGHPVLDEQGHFTLPWYRKFQGFSQSANSGGITQLTGAVTAIGPGVATAALSATGVTPGAYTAADITVGADGRISAAASGSAVSSDALSLVALSLLDGTVGARGAQGAMGPPGYDGQDGEDGWMGPPGPAGSLGPPGLRGAPGEDGEAGQDGLIGPPGVAGAAGAPGATGPTGPAGLMGFGFDGADGEEGPMGPPGAAAAGGAGTVTSVTAGAGLSGGTITSTGTIAVNHTITPQGRLTLVSATPVMTSDQTAKGTIYYAEQTGNLASVWDGTNMVPLTFSNLSLVLDTTNHLLNNVYDVFMYDSGSSTAALGASPAWVNTATVTWTSASPGVCTWTAHGLAEGAPVVFTAGTSTPTGITAGTTYFVSKTGLAANTFSVSTTVANAAAGTNVNTSSTGVGTQTGTNHTTVRGTGAGTTELQLKNGLQTNKNAITLYNNSVSSGSIAANKATYLGSFFCTANGQTGMAFAPAGANGGGNPILGLYNAYNRVRTSTTSLDTTGGADYTYNSTTWRGANGNVNNRAWWLDGLQQSTVWATNVVVGYTTVSATDGGVIGVNLDSTANAPTITAQAGEAGTTITSIVVDTIVVRPAFLPQLGLHYLQRMEAVTAGTYNFAGTGASPTRQNNSFNLSLDM